MKSSSTTISSSTARRRSISTRAFARRQPIIDYHCHLSPHQIADDHRWRSMTEIWLEGDHYKWRAMRAVGRSRALHHRRRVGLGEVRGVGVDRAADAAQPALPLDAPGAGVSVRRARQAAGPGHGEGDLRALQPQAGRARVHGAGDAGAVRRARRLQHRRSRRRSGAAPAPRGRTRAPPPSCCPTWRPDKALALHDPAGWNEWMDKLAAAADIDIRDLAACARRSPKRHAFFHARGCRASDHGLERIYAAPYTEAEAAAAFAAARAGKPLSPEQIEKLRSALCLRLRGHGSPARLGAAVPPRRHAQHQHARDARRSAPTPVTTPSATTRRAKRWRVSSIAWTPRDTWPRPSSTT